MNRSDILWLIAIIFCPIIAAFDFGSSKDKNDKDE